MVYQRGKEEGVKQVLMERFDNKPRVSSYMRVLAQICQYFINNANYALVSGKPRTPIPGECGSLAGDFSGF